MLGGFAEDETEEDVETAEGKKEEGGYEREVVNVMRKDASRNPVCDSVNVA